MFNQEFEPIPSNAICKSFHRESRKKNIVKFGLLSLIIITLNVIIKLLPIKTQDVLLHLFLGLPLSQAFCFDGNVMVGRMRPRRGSR